MSNVASLSPLSELKEFLTDWTVKCRKHRWYGALIGFEVAADINAEAMAKQDLAARHAYDAEQADLQAVEIIEAACADGLDASDLPKLLTALRHIRSSAQRDRAISDALAPASFFLPVSIRV